MFNFCGWCFNSFILIKCPVILKTKFKNQTAKHPSSNKLPYLPRSSWNTSSPPVSGEAPRVGPWKPRRSSGWRTGRWSATGWTACWWPGDAWSGLSGSVWWWWWSVSPVSPSPRPPSASALLPRGPRPSRPRWKWAGWQNCTCWKYTILLMCN